MPRYHTNMPCPKCKCEYVTSRYDKTTTKSGKLLNVMFFICGNIKCKFRRPKQQTKIYCPEEVLHHVEMDEKQLETICTPNDAGICITHSRRSSDRKYSP
jgi:hypothetical protein